MSTRMRLLPLLVLMGLLALPTIITTPALASQIIPTPTPIMVIPPRPTPVASVGPTATPADTITPAQAGQAGALILGIVLVLAIVALVFSFLILPALAGRHGPRRE